MVCSAKRSGDSIKKVGRNVGGDLTRTSKGYKLFYKGAIELASFCSVRKCIPSGTTNRLGKKYDGHYDSWLVQHIDLLRKKVGVEDIGTNVRHLAIEINVLNYRESKEVYGICSMPITEMEKIGIEKAENKSGLSGRHPTIPMLKDTVFLKTDSTLRPKNARYVYVAKMQRSKFAVVAVHTLDEIFLFNNLLTDWKNSNTNNKGNNEITINYEAFALKWNMIANGVSIFYKTPEHIEKYYN